LRQKPIKKADPLEAKEPANISKYKEIGGEGGIRTLEATFATYSLSRRTTAFEIAVNTGAWLAITADGSLYRTQASL